MIVTILVDNTTLIDRYFLAEPGICLLVEHEGQRTLLDTGYSDIFLRNAHRMGQDLLQPHRVVLSHGHLDHTWGLWHLITRRSEALLEGLLLPETPLPELVAHPLALEPKRKHPLAQIGSLLGPAQLEGQFRLRLSRTPLQLTERLWFLGEIPRRFAFEHNPHGGHGGDGQPDALQDDSSLAYVTDSGLVLLAGCAHAGVCNTLAHALEVTGATRVRDVVGGLHLLDAPEERLAATAAYLATLGLEALHPCHCTDFAARCGLARTLPVREVGVGLTLQYT